MSHQFRKNVLELILWLKEEQEQKETSPITVDCACSSEF